MKERLLLFGDRWSGKTEAEVSILHLYHENELPGRFFVLDTDDRFLKQANPAAHGRVKHYYCADWAAAEDAVRDIVNKQKPGPADWIIVDRIDDLWEMLPNFWTRQIYGKEIDEQYLEWRKNEEAKGGNPLLQDYTFGINQLYFTMEKSLLRQPCSIIWAAGATEVKVDGRFKDSAEIVKMYGPGTASEGVKPAGQKKVGARLDTVFYMEAAAQEKFYMSCRREAVYGRKRLPRSPVTPEANFAKQYLLGVCKYKAIKGKGLGREEKENE